MNGIVINDKQYIFIATSEDEYCVDCDKCDLKKDGYSSSCDALCINFRYLVHGTNGYGVFKELKEEK